MKELSQKIQDLICERYRSGATYSAVAREIGCNCTVVQRILKEHGIRKRKTKKDYLEENTIQITRRYQNDGLSVRQLAVEYNSSIPSMHRFLQSKNVLMRSNKAHFLIDREKELDICRAYLDWRNAANVGKVFGVSHVSVLRICRAYGIRLGYKQTKRRIK